MLNSRKLRAKGTTSWSAKARVRKGSSNRITVVATDSAKLRSAKQIARFRVR